MTIKYFSQYLVDLHFNLSFFILILHSAQFEVLSAISSAIVFGYFVEIEKSYIWFDHMSLLIFLQDSAEVVNVAD